MGRETAGPPVSIQIVSVVALVCLGLYSIVKGGSFDFFSWWYILGGSCLVAAAFACFRLYEACLAVAQRETSVGLSPGNP